MNQRWDWSWRLMPFVLALSLSSGCKNPDDGPQPFIFPAYPVRNLPNPAPGDYPKPVPQPPQYLQPGPRRVAPEPGKFTPAPPPVG